MNDRIIKKLKPHPLAFLSYYLGAPFLVLLAFPLFGYPAVVPAILLVAAAEFMRRAETFYIAENGVTQEFRLLSRRTVFAPYARIQDVNVSQGIVARMLGVGTIKINTAGGPGVEIVLHGIFNPHSMERLIRERLAKAVS